MGACGWNRSSNVQPLRSSMSLVYTGERRIAAEKAKPEQRVPVLDDGLRGLHESEGEIHGRFTIVALSHRIMKRDITHSHA